MIERRRNSEVDAAGDPRRDGLEARYHAPVEGRDKSGARRRSRQPTSNQKAKATSKKDALDSALGDLNKSTNQLRRKFDADARKINPALAHGSYGPEAARLWPCSEQGSTIWRAPTVCHRSEFRH